MFIIIYIIYIIYIINKKIETYLNINVYNKVMGRLRGRPRGTDQYDEKFILDHVDMEIPRTTHSITLNIKKTFPKIHDHTVLKYLKRMEVLNLVKEIYQSQNGGKVKVWIRRQMV